MEILIPLGRGRKTLKAVLFDFDGTLSTLRHGWEDVMAPMMIEILGIGSPNNGEIADVVTSYIDDSTGIQTIFQMQWLAEQVQAAGRTPKDPWEYKAEYNERLMRSVSKRRDAVEQGKASAEQYLIAGSRAFLEALRDRQKVLYVASGTDQADVKSEAEILGLAGYFREIAGALPGQASCSKEDVIRRVLGESGLSGEELAVIGDGRVEIAVAREHDAIALGVASDEQRLSGVNPVKRERLVKAGSHAIIGDFSDVNAILNWLGI